MEDEKLIGGFIAGAIVASTLVLTIYDCPKYPPPSPNENFLGRITMEEVRTLRGEYAENTTFPLMTRYTNSDGRDVVEKLQGFKLDANDLIELATANHSRQGNPDTIIFFIGQNGTFQDLSSPPITYPKINLIAVGVKGGVLLKDATIGSASIFDKADPCPPNCPN